jgi:hypothetical protein
MSLTEAHLRLLFILHRGLVQLRELGRSHGHDQVAELADALEWIPGRIPDLQLEELKSIKSSLETYQKQYPSTRFEYVSYMENAPIPPTF